MDSTKTKQRKVIAAHEMQLPWELIEEILSRVSPSSLVRFKTVCKRWNAILDDKMFINNHKETFRFIITTGSKLHSVGIDPKLVVRELTLGIPGLEYENPRHLFDCDEFVLCSMDKGAVVWNPWLKLSRCISQPNFKFQVIGCDSNRRSEESIYKTIWCNTGRVDRPPYLKIHDLASCTWKDASVEFSGGSSQEKKRKLITRSGVSLNGTLFWISFSDKTDPLYQLVTFDFSSEVFYIFCDLPCGKSHPCDALVLWVFKRDRFSVLKRCHITKTIEIWVTKNKVDVKDGNDVVWMSFMTFSIPNFPNLVSFRSYYQQPSYFIDDKRLVVCSCDENGQPWIYILGENKLIRKVQLDSIVGFWPSHCTYFPSLVPVPREKG